MFDQALIAANKKRADSYVKNSEFFNFIHSDLIHRLAPIDKKYFDVLWIGEQNQLLSTLLFDIACEKQQVTFLLPGKIQNLILDTEHKGVDNTNKKFDLICFPFGLHWVEEVQKFLWQIKGLLKEDGIFICNFAGAGSLANLRKTLFLTEELCNCSHSPHISPFIKFNDLASILQQAGFAENITDYEYLSLDFDSPIALMKALKKVGESNALVSRKYYSITKPMYKVLLEQSGGIFQDQVTLITMTSCPSKHSIKLKAEYFTK